MESIAYALVGMAIGIEIFLIASMVVGALWLRKAMSSMDDRIDQISVGGSGKNDDRMAYVPDEEYATEVQKRISKAMREGDKNDPFVRKMASSFDGLDE